MENMKDFADMTDQEVTDWVTRRAAQYNAGVFDLGNERDLPDTELMALAAGAEHLEENPELRPERWDGFYQALTTELHVRSGA